MARTVSGFTNLTVSDKLTLKTVVANGSVGTSGQILTSNGSATYWSTAAAAVNTAAQYAWTNNHTYSVGANAISLINGTQNWIAWNTVGVASPTVSSRSAGTKLALYPSLTAAQVDYAIGIESNHMWFSTDNATTGCKWYANTTNYMTSNVAGLYHTGVVNGSSHTVGSSFIANATGVYHTGTINAASYTVGTSFTANSTLTNTVSLVVSTNTATIGTGTYFVSNGNVGIGTASPGGKLTVAQPSGTYTSSSPFFSSLYDNTQHFNIYMDGNWNTHLNSIQVSTNQSALAFDTNGSERMRITSDGNIGIGTTTPSSYSNYKTITLNGATGGGAEIDLKVNDTLCGYIEATSSLVKFNAEGSRFFQWVGNGVERMRITSDGDVGIGTASPGYKLEVNGAFAATTKSFVIDHPSKKGMKLRHGSLEGPENGVYVRGRTNTNIIELPDYWVKLIDKDSITVSLTAIGKTVCPSVGKITNKKINLIGDNIDCFFHVFAERKDVEKLVVEY